MDRWTCLLLLGLFAAVPYVSSAARTEDDLPDAPEEGDIPLEYEDELDPASTAADVVPTTTTTTPAPQLPGRRRIRPLRPVKPGAKPAKEASQEGKPEVAAKPTKRPRPAPVVTTSRPKTTTHRSRDADDVTPGYRRPKFPPRRLSPRTSTTTTTLAPPLPEEAEGGELLEEIPVGDEGTGQPATP